jgi:oleate hydratase
MSTTVKDIAFSEDLNRATRITWECDGSVGTVDLSDNDLVFLTNGSIVENTDNGNHHRAAKLNTGPAPAWDLWKRIAALSPKGRFGHPEVFCSNIDATKFESCTVLTTNKTIIDRIAKICKRDPLSGKVVTGGIITAKDSKWLMSWTVARQPHFRKQPPGSVIIWVYGLLVEEDGDYVEKPMQDCTGEEIVQEWLYHMGVPKNQIPQLAETDCNAIPTMMPYVTSLFMPRKKGDRVPVIPNGAVNYAFLGQFAETKSHDCIFTTEYSVRTAMEVSMNYQNFHNNADKTGGIQSPWYRTRDPRGVRVHLRRPMCYRRIDSPPRR